MLESAVQHISPATVGPVVHVISDAGPHPYFRTLVQAGGLDPRSLIVGCVGPAGTLQEDMGELGVESFALGAVGRHELPVAVARLARILRRHAAPIVQSHLVDGSLVGLTAARFARTPLAVFTAHHSHELPYHGRRLIWPDRLCAGPLSDRIIAPSLQVAETLSRYTHVSPAKIAVVHHGFDMRALDPSATRGESVRAELELEGCTVLGVIGRLYALKNHANLIRAFAALGPRPDLRLVIAGHGDREPLQQIARTAGVGSRVLLVGARADVPTFLAACDAFVHPAVAESFGMVIVEAMAMGKPVLSTPVGIAPEVITTGESGLLTTGSTVGELVSGLKLLLSMRPRWGAVGAAARARVADFTAARMAEQYRKLYAAWLREAAP